MIQFELKTCPMRNRQEQEALGESLMSNRARRFSEERPLLAAASTF